MGKIAILNTTHFANKGSMGRIEGIVKCINEKMPGTEIIIFHRYYRQDKENLSKKLEDRYPNLEIKDHPWYKESNFKILTAMNSFTKLCYITSKYSLFGKKSLSKELGQSEAFVDLNFIEPDKFTEIYDWNSVVGNFFALLNVWYATMYGIPVMICSATVGPYHNKLLRNFAKFILEKADIITLREAYSDQYLKEIGVKKPLIELTADLAFLMDSPKTEKLQNILFKHGISSLDRPLIGITPTAMMNPHLPEVQYIRLISDLSNHLIDNLGATLIYISNTYQDIPIVDKIYEELNNKEKAKILPFDISAAETKGVIGTCDLFICSRFHALVASTSLGVPSIGLVAYSKNKFHGIIGKMMEQEKNLIDIDKDFEHNSILQIIIDRSKLLLENKESVALELNKMNGIVRDRTMMNCVILKEYLDNKNMVD